MVENKTVISVLIIIALISVISIFLFNPFALAVVNPSNPNLGTFVLRQDKAGTHSASVTVSLNSNSKTIGPHASLTFEVYGPNAGSIQYGSNAVLQSGTIYADFGMTAGNQGTFPFTLGPFNPVDNHALTNNGDYHIVFYLSEQDGTRIPLSNTGFDTSLSPSGTAWQFSLVQCNVNSDCNTGYACSSNSCIQQAVNYSISGSVYNDGTNSLLSGATVSLQGYGSVTTDGSGHFTFSNIPAGTYSVTISKTGFDTLTTSITVSPTLIFVFNINPTIILSYSGSVNARFV